MIILDLLSIGSLGSRGYDNIENITDLSFTAITKTLVAKNVINLSCSQTIGCININIDRVYITSSTPDKKVLANCFNAHDKATHTEPAIKCLLP
ncbi:Galacturan 1,4-alpha-galacturonidase [Handroanthus impetiginosus]|uniref:Galacturan 1,4-alpha-galacturonidase n=1 Tax=Handroanthus impetiginosus TaxID=429701 RepID=A0A2G9GJ11_9LAMI|nr:Galacturan 1,4-alpha-galacturonidase [Handroanthus impetiginosus]